MTKTEKQTAPFQFKQFAVQQDRCAMKVGTDGIMLGAWAQVDAATQALDIGTGTGVIALMLAQRAPEATIHAIDIDDVACEQAGENFASSPWEKRLSVIQEAIQDYARTTRTTYDLIVSNPPFFSGGTFGMKEERAIARQTVRMPHGDLLIAVRQLLAKNGRFCLVLPYLEGLRFQERAEEYHLFCTKVTEVRPKPDAAVNRLLMQFEQEDRPTETDQLAIRATEAEDSYTAAYRALLQEFLLKF
ncbi:tRNA1(Val) (adenine(37)-N6)-methyltransferase [Phaeodactylibacter xiamenensis]|uniref:tRNA1(Val) (adenine(37)-N6)-methyltransferase n=1 Tax=Phaeodactylibacter xiamenensis TaxID=1524460 RepID=UPI003CCC25EB